MTEHVSELLSAYLDGQVNVPERSRVEAHLAECAACRADLEELRTLASMLRRLPAQRPPRSFALGPRVVRPDALSGTMGGYLRAISSVAAALAVVAIGLSLIFRGLPRQTATVAAPAAAQVAASAAASQAPAAPARAAPAGAVAAASRPAAASAPAAAAAKPEANAAAPAAPAAGAKPAASAAASVAPAPPAVPAPSARPAAFGTQRAVDVPRLAGELLLLLVSLGLAAYSIRWWRR